MWQGIQAITNYRTAPPACDSDASLPDALNHFYARFEAQNGVAARKTTPPPDDQVLCLTAADVRKTLRRVNPRKAAGPDNIPARVLRECADQLTDVFTDIFNISLSSATVPTCLKATTIIPVPKKSSVSCLNDYRPIALTPIIMKCFERLVLRHIKTLLPPSLDPQQFAYRPNRSTDDAISTTLHLALTHLDNRDTYVRMLFIDFSSAFNTIIPQHLIGKLNLLGLNTSLSNWILDFLTGRPQSVRIGRNTSSTTTLSTGAPQGCVLSPLLFTLLTHDCAAMHSSNHIIKFADDTTVVGLISKNDESAYREEVQRLTDWCRTNNLSLNVDKTKEMVVDFRRTRRDHSPLHIDGSTVEIVKSTKFLGVHLAEDLTWSLNTSTITKKAQQRLYFLRRLRKAHLPPPILTTFYRGTIESILSSCITAWFGNCTVSDRKSLQRVVRTAEKIIGVSLPTITDIYTTRCIRKANSIVDDYTHPSHTLFTLLPSGKSASRPLRQLIVTKTAMVWLQTVIERLRMAAGHPAYVLVETTNEFVCGGTVVSTKIVSNGLSSRITHPEGRNQNMKKLDRKMDTNVTNSTLYDLHPLIQSISSATVMYMHIINLTLSLPLNIYVIILLKRAGGLDGFVIFSLFQAASEILFALPAPLFILCYMDVRNLCLVQPIVFFTTVCMCTRFLFQCCVCFERYLAVVHPILFLKNKSMKYRLASSTVIWTCSIIDGIMSVRDFSSLPYTVYGILYAIILSMHLFFCFSILRVLRRPGPSERERADGGANAIKKKAFEVVFFNLLAFLIQTIPIAAAMGIGTMLPPGTFRLAFIVSMTINIGAGIVQSILILHQMGKLPFGSCV
ncbi:hypothetical protein NFI96_000714 [Prochilodus magdalenae]|nr:hypothetical protein NFI96_000714 [Prochilodus magdalenae]